MSTLNDAVNGFLERTRIAVAGVSRDPRQAANTIFRKLRDHGYQTFAVNPAAEEVEGEECYPDLRSIPAGVEAVVVATPPEATEQVVRECSDLGIPRVWMHRSFGQGSVSGSAVEYCREHGIEVIPGGCPMMYLEPDVAHRCMRWVLGVLGRLPEPR